MSNNYYQTPITKDNVQCCYTTIRNKQCKNKASEYDKCTYHNNRINNIINSDVCRKLVFDECEANIFVKQDELNGTFINIFNKCKDIATNHNHNIYYCDQHAINYKYEIPEDCVICSETISYDKEIPLQCGHWFHLNCLKQYDKIQCPMCRTTYKSKEIRMIFNMVTILFRECDNNNIEFYLLIPLNIVENEKYGLLFVEILYMEIVMLYRSLNLQYTTEIINKVMVNMLKNEEYLNISYKVFNMFEQNVENGVVTSYILNNEIDFDTDNEHSLTYDRFQEIIENLYHS